MLRFVRDDAVDTDSCALFFFFKFASTDSEVKQATYVASKFPSAVVNNIEVLTHVDQHQHVQFVGAAHPECDPHVRSACTTEPANQHHQFDMVKMMAG